MPWTQDKIKWCERDERRKKKKKRSRKKRNLISIFVWNTFSCTQCLACEWLIDLKETKCTIWCNRQFDYWMEEHAVMEGHECAFVTRKILSFNRTALLIELISLIIEKNMEKKFVYQYKKKKKELYLLIQWRHQFVSIPNTKMCAKLIHCRRSLNLRLAQ